MSEPTPAVDSPPTSQPVPTSKPSWLKTHSACLSACGTLLVLSVLGGATLWSKLPPTPEATPTRPIVLEQPTDPVRVGVPFVVKYETTSPATWIDPEQDGMHVHGGPEVRDGKTYKGNASITVTQPGKYSYGLAVAQGSRIVYLIGHAETDGQPAPTPLPTPVPVVSDLQKSLQAAYETELDPAKSSHTAGLADVMVNFVPMAKASGKVKTHKDFTTAAKAATDAAIGATAIPKVRLAAGGWLASKLPTDPSGVADDGYWAATDAAYKTLSDSLKGVKR